MANWIKMRTDLHSHPKVVRIVSALNADVCPQSVRLASEKFRAIGGLHAVWSLFDTHSDDGKLAGYSPETLDAVLGFPGLAGAMIAVDWLAYTQNTLVLPEFDTHNGQSAKRRAQEADRKKDVRKTSALDADKKRTRIDKNRIDIKDPIVPAGDVLPKPLWDEFVSHRKQIGKPLNDLSTGRMIAKLAKLKATGVDVQAAVDDSIRNGWQDVFAPKAGTKAATDTPWAGAL